MPDKPINQFTDDELRRAMTQATGIVSEIQREQRKRRLEAQKSRAEEIKTKVDSYLDVVHHHSGAGCSDESSSNAFGGRCVRCSLLETKENQYWDAHYDLVADIRLIENDD